MPNYKTAAEKLQIFLNPAQGDLNRKWGDKYVRSDPKWSDPAAVKANK